MGPLIRICRAALLSLGVCLTGVAPLGAQTQMMPGKAASEKAPTESALQAAAKEADEATDLSDADKKAVKDLYQQALQDLAATQKSAQQRGDFEKLATDVDERLGRLQAELAKPVPNKPLPPLPQDQLQQRLMEVRTRLRTAREELARLEAEPARRQIRRLEIPGELKILQQRRADLEKQLEAAAPAGEAPRLTQARRARLLTSRDRTVAEISALEKEQLAYTATSRLLPVERDLASRRVHEAQTALEQLQSALDSVRGAEAEAQAAAARQAAATAKPALRPLALVNQRLAEENATLVGRLQEATGRLQRSAAQLDQLQRQFQRAKERVEGTGLTGAIGLLLRKQRSGLPKLHVLRDRKQARVAEIQESQLRLLELDDQRSDLSDLDELTQRTRRALTGSPSQKSVRELLEKKRDYLDSVLQNQNALFEKLVDLDSTEEALRKLTAEYVTYIDERVLWIRSTPVLGLADLYQAADAFAWLVAPENWRALGQGLLRDLWRNGLLLVLCAVLLAVLVWRQAMLRALLEKAGREASAADCRRFGPTLRAVGITALLASACPLLMGFLGWRLMTIPEAPFARALGIGLVICSAYCGGVEWLRQWCRPFGLADAHFGWPEPLQISLYRHLTWFVWLTAPLVLLIGVLHAQSADAWRDSAARIGSLLGFALLTGFLHLLFRARSPLMQYAAAEYPDSTWVRWQRLLYALIVAPPLVLATLDVLGYHYTTTQLLIRVQLTAWLFLALLLATSLLLRWFLVSRHALDEADAAEAEADEAEADEAPADDSREETTSAKTSEKAAETDDGSRQHAGQGADREEGADREVEDGEEGKENDEEERLLHVPAVDAVQESIPAAVQKEQQFDLLASVAQSRQLLNTILFLAAIVGAWAIWADILPALRVLDGVELWKVRINERIEVVTLHHLLFAGLIAGVTALAVKNIPGLLELLFLRHLVLDAGARYAIITISRYAIIITGLIAAGAAMQLQLGQYQWLIAAVTVGLGFGLQEIFGNFVSGLIVLLERPVRVGDVVTVGGVTGIVSRIRMRATTVVNWDRQEFIVPNKEFVTGRLLNWTLTNSTNRVVIQVGAAYDCDPQQALQILLEVAHANDHVLEEPAPQASFDAFGDSSLTLTLRCFLASMDVRLKTTTALHLAIFTRFREAGIEIAFPQHDVWLRTKEQ